MVLLLKEKVSINFYIYIIEKSKYIDSIVYLNNEDNTDSNPIYLLVLEYADSGTLGNYLKDNFNNLDWNIKLQFAIQIVDAVLCIHQNDIIHCDLVSI